MMCSKRVLVRVVPSLLAGLAAAFAIMASTGSASQPSATADMASVASPTLLSSLPAAATPFVNSDHPAGIADELFEGSWLVDETRLLLSHGDWAVYATPTSKGNVCFSLVRGDSAAGGCVGSFSPGESTGTVVYDPDVVNAGHPAVIGGIVPDDVTDVDVLVDGTWHASSLSNNAYILELNHPGAYPDAIRIVTANGRQTTNLPDPRPAMLRVQETG